MDVTETDVKRIKISRTYFQIILHYLYYVFKKFIHYKKQLLEDFILYDNGMKIKKSFIPYEYIISFNTTSLILLAKQEDDTIVPADSIIKIKFNTTIDTDIIKNNLYYHLKYNNINMEIFQFKTVKFQF
jgi:hypothetical protein